jgi:predicted DNA-binding transcriptional regulator AlpA
MMSQDDLVQRALALQVTAAVRAALSEANNVSCATIIYLNAAQVRERYGGISDMTLWRWLRDGKLAFPRPHRINRLRYWKVSELLEWERTRQDNGKAA